jgi:hypothetical protein
MVSTVIDILNARLELTGFFHSLYCLAEKKREKREEGDFIFPAQYVGGGDLRMIEFDSAGFAYFRKDGEITQSIVENDFGQSQWYEVTIPLRLVAMVNRSAINGDDAFSPDALARQLASSLTFKNGDLRTALTAAKTQVNAANWITDPEQIWSDETEGTGAIEPDYSRAFIAMSVTVSVTADEKCIQNLCEADTDILHIFDFCKAATVARLTPAQVACLEAALCEVPPTLCEQLAEVEPADVVADVFDCLTEAAQDELLDSQCPVIPPCDPLTVTFDGEVIATIAEPCGETVAFDCATLTTSAFVENGGAVTGTYAPDGIINGKTKYTKNSSNYLFYNGTRWELEKTGANVLASAGDEDTPWLATWPTLTVTQATIGEYCANCATGTVEVRNTDGVLIATVTVASGGVQPYVIPNVAWTQSDGSPQSTAYGNAIVCTPPPPPSSGWVRPAEWIPIPDLTASDERFYGILPIFENSYNLAAVAITNLAANIDWGDGSSVVSNGSVQFRVYDYTSIGSAVNQWPDGRNYKQVLVDITRVGGALTSVNFYGTTTINARGGNNFVDINCSFPNATTLALSLEPVSGTKAMLYCQRLRVWSRPAGHTATNLLRGMRSLRGLQYPFSSIGVAANFSLSSGQLDDAGNVDLGTATQVNGFWQDSQLKKHGNLTANSATSLLVGYASGCLQLREFGDVEAQLCTALNSMWTNCVVLTRIGVINTPLNQNLSTTFNNCYLLEGVEFTSCAAVTVTTNCFNNCVSLTWAIMPGLTVGISFANTAMGNFGMNLFANSIGTASGTQNITVTGTPFGALLAAADATAVAIAAVITGKGFGIIN